MHYFLKISMRAIKMKIIPFYKAECGFNSTNNNFYSWKFYNDDIFTNLKKIENF